MRELKCKECGHNEIVGIVPVKMLLDSNGEILDGDYTKTLGECPMPDYYECAKCYTQISRKEYSRMYRGRNIERLY